MWEGSRPGRSYLRAKSRRSQHGELTRTGREERENPEEYDGVEAERNNVFETRGGSLEMGVMLRSRKRMKM